MTVQQRRLVAILAMDVAGYSRLMEADEAGTLARLAALRRDVLEPAFGRRSGRLFKAMGDGFLVEFASAVEAVACAAEIQRQAPALPLRIGIHLGDVIVQGDDLMGEGVNIAARIEGIAEPGGIAISRQVYDQVQGKLDLDFQDRGEVAVKNLARPVHVFAVLRTAAKETAAPAPALPALALPDRPSIAVLPFQNMSGDPEQGYFADGLVEDIITALSRFKSLFVIARNSSFAFRGEALDARSIGERLGVRYLVEGGVRRSGPRLRLTVQLIEAATRTPLWADRYDGTLGEVFDFQDKIVASLVGAIEPKLWTTEIARSHRKRPDSLTAFDVFLQALPNVAIMSAESIAVASDLLDRAIELSPGYAEALAYAAFCRALRPILGYSDDEGKDLREAAELSRRALVCDPLDPTALRLSAFIAAALHRDYHAAKDLIDRSLAINPNDALAWNTRGWISTWVGESETAISEFEHAMRLSPLDPYWSSTAKHGMALALCYQGRPEEALPWAQKALKERPDLSVAHRSMIGALWLAGRHEEARIAVIAHDQQFPGYSVSHDRAVSPVAGTPGQERYFEALRAAGLPE